MTKVKWIATLIGLILIAGCEKKEDSRIPIQEEARQTIPDPQYTITADQTHNRFSRTIEPVLEVTSGSVIEVFTKEATDDQLDVNSTSEDVLNIDFDPIHPLTGPVYVEGAEPGDILAVKLHKIEVGDWGWTAIIPGFGFLADDFTEPYLKIFNLENKEYAVLNERIKIPLKPFAGVMGVAPDTDSLLSTIPPRANGGNMDDPNMTEGTTVYFPVFVKGALFSIGDTHAVQGLGEVCGTAVESPMRIVYEVNVIKGKPSIAEPQYETDDYYAVTAFSTTIDEAARKATQFMIEHLVQTYNMSKEEAYILCSLAGDLKIAEVVDVPHVLVVMHMDKSIFTN